MKPAANVRGVIATHVVWTTYGFWLPNDPRGSGSSFVGSEALYRHGGATRVSTRRSVAGRLHDASARRAAKGALRFAPVRLTGEQARSVAAGLGEAAAESGYVVRACCVMPDHVHVVVDAHAKPGEAVRDHLKARATRRLTRDGVHPFGAMATPRSPWARKGWVVFLDTPADVRRAVAYVEANPARSGLRSQRWSFVTR